MKKTEVLIVGSGFGGLGMARHLKQAGIQDFLVLEKADEVGGTWRENTYPGAECDVPSSLYSYSFALNPDWKHKWSKQEQIFEYQKKCANDFGLYPHIRFGQPVRSAVFDATRGRWTVNTASGDQYDCHHFISALGQLHHPSTPNIAGQVEFRGPQFHSANWQHDVDLSGKRVAVIGNAASAIQFIPFVAEQSAQLTVYQRSANWVLPKGDRPYSRFEKWVARNVPLAARLSRLGAWAKGEYILYPMIAGSKPWSLRGWCLSGSRFVRQPRFIDSVPRTVQRVSAGEIPDLCVGQRHEPGTGQLRLDLSQCDHQRTLVVQQYSVVYPARCRGPLGSCTANETDRLLQRRVQIGICVAQV